jgi:PKHD-type hydroxylase
MSEYIFAPDPTFGIGEHPFVTWQNGFNNYEIQKIIEMGESRKITKAQTGDGTFDDNRIRKSNVSWIDLQEDSEWVYDKLSYIVRQLNGQFYKFDLYGFVEHFQYTVYDGNVDGHYTWHQDFGGGKNFDYSQRKLSLVLQLSDPSEYEGGDLQVFTGMDPTSIDKQKGLVTAFPSYTLHRVTPVTRGIRRTLVVWIAGPGFK